MSEKKTNPETEGLLKKIKMFFSELKIEAAAADISTDVVLDGGGKAKVYGDLIAGSKVMLVADDGTESPAPDGPVELEDGSIITIKGGAGIIDSVTPPPAGEAAMSEDVKTLQASYKELQNKYDALVKGSETAKTEASKMRSDLDTLTKISKETFSLVEKIAAMPEGKAVETKSKENFEKQNSSENIYNIIKHLKN